MKKISIFLLTILVFPFWVGCASVGKEFNSKKVKNIENNVDEFLDSLEKQVQKKTCINEN